MISLTVLSVALGLEIGLFVLASVRSVGTDRRNPFWRQA